MIKAKFKINRLNKMSILFNSDLIFTELEIDSAILKARLN